MQTEMSIEIERPITQVFDYTTNNVAKLVCPTALPVLCLRHCWSPIIVRAVEHILVTTSDPRLPWPFLFR
jgi:hypothetical protein